MSDPGDRRARAGLLAVFLLALAVRVGATAYLQGLSAPPKASANPDQMDYEAYAWSVATGAGYSTADGNLTARRPPGTSFTLVPVYLAFGRSNTAARLWWCVLSAATCPAAGWLAWRCFGRQFAVPAAAWLAVYPGHLYYATHLLSETPAAFYLTLATGFTVAGLRGGRWRDDAATGIFWGLAALTRPNLILAAPLAALPRLLRPPGSAGRSLGKLAVQAGALAIVVGPWLARNAVLFGEPAVCTVVGGYTFWGAHNEKVFNDPALRGGWVRTSDLVDAEHPLPGDEVGMGRTAQAYGMRFVREHAADMPALVGRKLLRLVWLPAETANGTAWWAFAVGWFVTAPFALLGFVRSWRRSAAAAIGLAVPVVVTVVTAAIFYGSERFRDGISPVLVVYAALGAVGIVEPRREETGGRKSQPAAELGGFAVPVSLIGLLAVALRLTVLALGPWQNPERALRADSPRYVLLARNLLEYGTFGKTTEDGRMHQAVARLRSENGTDPRRDANGLAPESFRTPAYPAFLAAVFRAGGDLRAVLVIQCILGGAAAALVVAVARSLGLSRAAALLAGLGWAVHPALVLYDNLILTESLFNTGAVAALFLSARARGLAGALLAGVTLGVTGLVRPVGFLYVPAALALGWRRYPRYALAVAGLAAAAVLPPVLWAARNGAVGEGFRVSTVGDLNFLFYSAAYATSEERGEDWLASWPRRVAEAEAELGGRLAPGEDVVTAARRLAFEKMAARPGVTAKTHAKSQLKLLVDHSAGDFADLLGIPYRPTGLFSRLVLGGDPGEEGAGAAQIAVTLAWVILNVLIAVATFAGVLLGLWRRCYRLLAVCVPTILLFMAATGCVGLERFRVPMLLPMLLLSASVVGCRPMVKPDARHP